jgi:hypothetical protein
MNNILILFLIRLVIFVIFFQFNLMFININEACHRLHEVDQQQQEQLLKQGQQQEQQQHLIKHQVNFSLSL